MKEDHKQKLVDRAKRFSGTSEDAKSKARTERFGTGSVTAEDDSPDRVEKLKQRAERFGMPRPVIRREEEEKRARRQAKFGHSTVGAKPVSHFDEKFAKRAERFGAKA